MKKIVPVVIVLAIAFFSYVLAAAQLWLGYVTTGRAGNRRKIYASENPEAFWTVTTLFILIGTVFFLWAMLMIFWKGSRRQEL